MSRTGRWLALLASVWMGTACQAHSAPAEFLPDAEAAQRRAQGGWIDLTVRAGGGVVRGELIAVSEDSVWVLTSSGGRVVPTADVVEGRLVGYDPEPGQVGLATGGGLLSTLSNGVFLVFTAPMWAIGGGLAARSQSRIATQDVPGTGWLDLAPFARFPQGLPDSVDFGSLRWIPR